MTKQPPGARPLVVLAFSGGLDTSLCLAWLRAETGADVVTATVDTGGFAPRELAEIAARAKALGARAHHELDAKDEVYERFVKVLIQGNILRGKAYPLCVAAERVVQAERVAKLARELGASALAHGSTGAGNDQVRFDAVFSAVAPDLTIHAPVRSLGWTRDQEAAYLKEKGFPVPEKTQAYSVNSGLWGVTVGGRETHDPWVEVPDSAFPSGAQAAPAPAPLSVVVGFERGAPVSLDGKSLGGVELVRELDRLGRRYGVGRGLHLGDTVLGIKGRVAFEAPAPLMLIVAHRELEKLVLTRWQAFWKDHVAEFYGQLLHEGLAYDPVLRDIEAMIASSQEAVTGEARLKLSAGSFAVTGVRSPRSLMAAQKAAYGERSGLWTGAEAAGFGRLHALGMSLAHQVREKAEAGS